MWLSTNTASPGNSGMRRMILALGLVLSSIKVSPAQVEAPRPPATVIAGNDFSISTAGNGKGTFYLVGPSQVIKRQVVLGQDINIEGADASTAGRYLAIVCSRICQSSPLWIKPAETASLNLLVHPSRVPVQADNAVSAVAIPLDRFRNLVLAPVTVNFRFDVGNTQVAANSTATQNGVAWMRAR